MNLKELAIMFVVCGVEGQSGRFKIKARNPKCYVFESDTGTVYGVRINHQSKSYLLFNNRPRFDVAWGNYTHSTKSEEILRVMKSILDGMINIRAHFTSSIDLASDRHIKETFQAIWGDDIAKCLESETVENERLINDLVRTEHTLNLLRTPEGHILAASPVKNCKKCGAFVRPRHIVESTQTRLEPNGEVAENPETGEPILEMQSMCAKCYEDAIPEIEMDGLHAHATPIYKSQTTFTKWPFSRTAGVELETVVVARIDANQLRSLGWRMVHDGSIKIPNGKAWKAIEFNSPPASGDAFFDSIRDGMRLWASRTRVNESCGFHVHIDWTDLDPSQKANTYNFLVAMERLMFATQPPSRRDNGYCRTYGKGAPFVKAGQVKRTEKYMGINFSHAEAAPTLADTRRVDGSYGTVEFRMGAGTRNVQKVLMWTEFCHRLIEIGAEMTSPDMWNSVRGMPIADQLSLFENLSAKCDKACERPKGYLDALIPWLKQRIEKFQNYKITTKTIHVDVKAKEKESFAKAVMTPVTPVSEIYEERLGIA